MRPAAFPEKKNHILTYEKFIRSYNIKEKQKQLVKQWFPLYPSAELAEIAAALMTDGHIDWRDGRPSKLILYSDYRNECKWFLDKIYELFQVRGKIVRYSSMTGFSKSHSYKSIVYCAPLARVLISIGIPYGDKTQREYNVPDWIMNAGNEIKQSFLKVLFNFDGSISVKKSRRSTATITLSFNKQKKRVNNGKLFLLQIKKLLNEFDIASGSIHIRQCRKDKYTLILSLTNQRSIINFYKQIGFLGREKQGRLQKFIYKIYRNARIPFSAMPFLLTELKKKLGTDKTAVMEINRISKTPFTYRQFEHMRRDGLDIPIEMAVAAIKILGKKEYFGKIPQHYQYVVKIYDEDFS